MEIITKWAGKRHKAREPIRARERSRRLGPPLRFTFHVSRLAAPEHQSGGGFTPIVTAELDIFFTISPSHFENTPHRPLPLNHLRKLREETVQFSVDFAPASSPPGCHHAPFR
jgi:hypothetical protein